MNEIERCPGCGMEQARVQILLDNQRCEFRCGTEILLDGDVYESKQCLRNQLTAANAENERLIRYTEAANAKIERLRDERNKALATIYEMLLEAAKPAGIIARLDAEIERLQLEVDDANLLLGDAWQNVVSLAKRDGIEAALRAQIAKLAGDVAELTEAAKADDE